MGPHPWLGGILVWLWVGPALQRELVYRRSGNASIFGVFDVGAARSLEEVAAAIWTVEALNNYGYLPGVSIGLSVFAGCDAGEDRRALEEAIEEEAGLQDTVDLGILTTGEIYDKLEGSLKGNAVPIRHAIDADTLTELVVQLLASLQWTAVSAVASDSPRVLDSFPAKAAQEGIRVERRLSIDEELLDQAETSDERPNPPVIVVLAPFARFRAVVESAGNASTVQLILVPTDFVFGPVSGLPEDAVVLLPAMEDAAILSKFISNPEHHRDFFGHRGPTKSPLFLGTAAAVLRLLDPIRRLPRRGCPGGPCAPAVDFLEDVKTNRTALPAHGSSDDSPDDVDATLAALRIEARPNDEMFLWIASLQGGRGPEDLAIFRVLPPGRLRGEASGPILLMIDDGVLGGRRTTTTNGTRTRTPLIELLVSRSPGGEGAVAPATRPPCEEAPRGCGNRSEAAGTDDASPGEEALPVWRFLTWVSVNTAVGVVGVLCTASVLLFAVVRMCEGRTPEASAAFPLLLTVSVILVYASSVPFHLEGGERVCLFRANGPPAALALLLSLMLSRVVVSAFAHEEEALVGHLNGRLQCVLCLFMLGVQASLTSQGLLRKCSDVHDRHGMLVALSYDFFLLALLVCVSPFVVRSKRRFREGLLLSVSVFLVAIVWAVWVSCQVSLAKDRRDAAVALALNATATLVLFCVLVPRTYLLAGSPPPEEGVPSLGYLERNILSGDKSSDSVFGTYNPNFAGETRADGPECRPRDFSP